MNDTIEAEAETKTAGFNFDGAGRCTNPERVRVPMKGVVCHLLVAMAPWEGWFGGYAIGGPTVKYREQAVIDPGAGKADSRDEALTKAAAALDAVLDVSNDRDWECMGELQNFVQGTPPALTLVEFMAKKKAEATEETPPAFGGYASGRTVEFATREDAEAYLAEQDARAGASDYETSIRKNGATYDLIYARKAQGTMETVSLMELCGRMEQLTEALAGKKMKAAERKVLEAEKTAIDAELTRREIVGAELRAAEDAQRPQGTEARAAEERDFNDMAEAPVAPVLPGLAHEANADGVFENAERVAVPMPKRASCEIQLACGASGEWVYGLTLQLPSVGRGEPACVNGTRYPERSAALWAALEKAVEFFANTGAGAANLSAAEKKIAERAHGAVLDFMGDPQFTPLAPAPVVRIAPVYHTQFMDLPVAKIQENPENDRKAFSVVKDRELADSLLTEGLHQPIAVRRLLDGEVPNGEFPLGDASAPEYELIFGHRRRRAAIMAGMLAIQAKVYHGLARKQATALALIENLQRENLNAMEEAEGYARLMRDEVLTHEGCASRVGRARSTVTSSLGLLRLPEVIREYIREGKLTAEHGKGLKRFVPDAKDAAKWAEEFPAWESVVKIMAEQSIEQKVPSAALDRGIPFIHTLVQAGVAVRIDQFGEHRLNGKQREHAAYFPVGDGDWVCFHPAHWQAEVAERLRKAAEAAEAERKKQAETLEALAKGGRKQLRIEDLKAEDYRQLTGVNEGLVDLVPDGKKQAAKGAAGRTTVVTDVQLADRLQKAMLKEIKANRTEAVVELEKKVRKKIAALKKVGPREMAWLVYLITDAADRNMYLHLTGDAAKAAGVKLPAAALAQETDWDRVEAAPKRLAALAKAEPVALVRTLMAERLNHALYEIVATGPDSVGARFVRWWLESETLWLLEETDEGRRELVERVKASTWYAKAIAGEAGEGGE